MEASCHSSVAASAIYIETGVVSESHRFQAPGYPVPKIDVNPIYPLISVHQKAVDFDDVRKPAAKKIRKNSKPISDSCVVHFLHVYHLLTKNSLLCCFIFNFRLIMKKLQSRLPIKIKKILRL